MSDVLDPLEALDASVSTVLLVEGVSDVAAIEALARVTGVDLAASGVRPIAMGGATNIRRFVLALTDTGLRIGGLVDAAEAEFFASALGAQRGELGRRGFFVCDPDLEVELVRALGIEGAIGVITEHGDLRRWLTFSNQPFQRGRPIEERLHRFFGTTSGRKEAYGTALVEGLASVTAPTPLVDLLRYATVGGGS